MHVTTSPLDPKMTTNRATDSPALRPSRAAAAIAGLLAGSAALAFSELLAAERPMRGLILMSYPLHRPGGQETWDERTAHWSRISCPVLVLSGESDPFAQIGLLGEAMARLTHGELATYPGVGHGIGPVLGDALDRIRDFVGGLG